MSKNAYTGHIDGWFDWEDLYIELATRSTDQSVIVEIGVWQGKSIGFLARHLQEREKSPTLYAVDTFQGNPGLSPHKTAIKNLGGDLRAVFISNMQALQVGDMITTMAMPSVEAAEEFEDESVDFVFIDGDHSYGAVKQDIEKWYPKVKSGGIIAGHDWCAGWPGVQRAVEEFFSQRPDEKIEIIRPHSWKVKKAIIFANLKVTELKKIAKTRGLKGYSRLKKSELIKLLEK